VLYEIENIPYRLGKDMLISEVRINEKKKKIATESS
jgi:hypothetical protein